MIKHLSSHKFNPLKEKEDRSFLESIIIKLARAITISCIIHE